MSNGNGKGSEATLDVLYTMAGIAIYNTVGIIDALKYLTMHGYTQEEAVDIIALYDHYCELCRNGQQSKLMNSPKGPDDQTH